MLRTVFALERSNSGLPLLHVAVHTFPDWAEVKCGGKVACSAFFAAEAGLDAMSRSVEAEYGWGNDCCPACRQAAGLG